MVSLPTALIALQACCWPCPAAARYQLKQLPPWLPHLQNKATLCAERYAEKQAMTCTSLHSLLLIAHPETMSWSPRMLNIWSKTCLRHHTVVTLRNIPEGFERLQEGFEGICVNNHS